MLTRRLASLLLAGSGMLAAIGVAAGLAASPAGAAPAPHAGAGPEHSGLAHAPAGWTRAAAAATAAARAVVPQAATPAWCSAHGSTFAGWSGTFPDLPLCGPGPLYGGTWSYVDQPGPSGEVAGYYNATPGFQCVELADRWLALADGLAPVLAEGSQVAMNYHAAYASLTTLVVNGSRGATGHPPLPGDVISFSQVPDFQDPADGHVAVVVSSRVDPRSGDGVVGIAQENVAPTEMRRDLLLEHWRLIDPTEPPNAEWQFPYAEWLHVLARPVPVLRAQALARLRMQRAERQAARALDIALLRAVAGTPPARAGSAPRLTAASGPSASTARPGGRPQRPVTAGVVISGALLSWRTAGRSRRRAHRGRRAHRAHRGRARYAGGRLEA